MSNLTIIVAMDQQRGIGIKNTLPWKLPEDLAHFKRLTTGRSIIMGRKTFDSIGRPLPNRTNIVVTRNAAWKHEGATHALFLAGAIALLPDGHGYVIGGADIYRQTMSLADTLIVTEIGGVYDCDAFFPEIDLKVWQETTREQHVSEASGLPYAFVTYERRV